MKSKQLYMVLLILVITTSCEYQVPEPIPATPFNPGTADFSQMAVLGDGLGAGFMDGSLYSQSQETSFGNLLSHQLNLHNPTPISFNQPTINTENGYNILESASEIRGKYFLRFISPGDTQLFKDTNPGEFPDPYAGPLLNNFSVPFLRTPQVFDPNLSTNPFFERFAENPGTSLLMDQLLASQPSLTIIQLGWYDVLAYAMGGLTGSINPDPGSIGSTDLTPIDQFRESCQQVVDQLLQQTDSEIILTNLPDVSEFPFFNSISPRAFLEGQEVDFLANFYRDFNIQVGRSNANQEVRRPTIKFFSDDPPHLWLAVVEDTSLVDRTQEDGSPLPKYRQLEDGEFILWSVPQLPSMDEQALGTTQPLPKSFYFTRDNFSEIKTIVEEYNNIIADISKSSPRLHLFDWYNITEPWVNEGVTFNGVLHTYDFNRTGMFSADGIGFNSRGSALLANSLIEFLNEKFQSNITLIDVNSFPGNDFVNDF